MVITSIDDIEEGSIVLMRRSDGAIVEGKVVILSKNYTEKNRFAVIWKHDPEYWYSYKISDRGVTLPAGMKMEVVKPGENAEKEILQIKIKW
jgi:hypothetical protein